MSDELWARALALPPDERAALAHALLDSLYENVDWDDGVGSYQPERSGVPPQVGAVVQLEGQRRRVPSKRG